MWYRSVPQINHSHIRKQRRIIMKKTLVLILIAASLICVACVNRKPKYDWNEFSYIVSDGETLWSIAEEYCPEDMDCCEYIYEIKKLNKMEKSNIITGQTITLLTIEEEI
jgi:hypothetical protein